MTTATRSARKPAHPFPCPAGCGYAMDTSGSVAAHLAMAHPEVPMDQVAPKRPRSAVVDPDACVRDKAGCATHDAVWIAADERCHARGGRISPAIPNPVSAPATDSPAVAGAPSLVELPLDLVDVGHNVRINVAELEELAASIAEHGVLQPIKATGPHADGRYLVTWGQRRTIASRMTGRTTIPAFVLAPDADVDADGAARSIEQLVENLHRADLNPIDRATAMRAVVDSGVSQADLARKLGIAPSTVANDLRLLETAPAVQELLRDGALTPAHAKAIAGLSLEDQADLAKRAVKESWSAHDAERQAKWAKESAAQRATNRERASRLTAEAISLLEKVANRKRSTIGISSYAGVDVRAALEADGWQLVEGWLEAVKEPGACGCAGVWRLDLPYGDAPVALKPACNDAAHKAARKAESDAAWAREREERESARIAQETAATDRVGRREVALRPHVDALEPELARVLVYLVAEQDSRGYGEELVNRHAPEGTEDDPDVIDDPWAEVISVLADDVARSEAARALAIAIEALVPVWRPDDSSPARDAIDSWLGILEQASQGEAAKPRDSVA